VKRFYTKLQALLWIETRGRGRVFYAPNLRFPGRDWIVQ
jgi:hypothetical protein